MIIHFVIAASLLMVTSCKHSKTHLPPAQLSTYGGKEYKSFVELPPYFVELLEKSKNQNIVLSQPNSSIEKSPDSTNPISDISINSFGYCSGSHIGNGYILTAAHCLDRLLCTANSDELKNFGIRCPITFYDTTLLQDTPPLITFYAPTLLQVMPPSVM
ncbi:MAG: hypothetical protein OXC44_02350 [Proteobacteria bacterium]|nr:hypothetical protein [Pseudomonadota bacterium]